MKSMHFESNILSALRGQFSPNQFGARLFMHCDDIVTPSNYLVWFHERFHYLQSIFTPYGHLKWAAYRTVTSDVISSWLSLTEMFKKERKIPISEYINPDDYDSLRIALNVWLHNLVYKHYDILENGNQDSDFFQLMHHSHEVEISPEIVVQGKVYHLRGIDILESYAKFEEAMLAELITGKNLDESIDPSRLNTEYYIALYYFLEQIGPERLSEFPVVCELALGNAHMVHPVKLDEFRKYAPSWRFVRIIDIIKTADLPMLDFNNDDSFYTYANAVLKYCGYESYEESWEAAESYAAQADLHMAREMKRAIDYKRQHPWMLSYPMCSEEFISEEFNAFEPYFTITEDGVIYNIDRITPSELWFENHFQAFASQICGQISPYCQDVSRIMCGFSYNGTNTCPHYISGECDGYIDHESVLPGIIMDEAKNIINGCTFEIVLGIMGINIKDIKIGRMRSLRYSEIKQAIDQYHTNHSPKDIAVE